MLGEVQPAHVFSIEGFKDLKKILNKDAIVIINFQGNIDDPVYSVGPRSIFKTLETAGYHVRYYSPKSSIDDEVNLTKNIFLLASLEDHNYRDMMKDLRYNEWFLYENIYYKNLINEIPLDLSDA